MKRKIKRGLYVPTSRDRDLYESWISGLTLQSVGNIYDLTRERVRQILKATYGLTAKDNIKRRDRSLINQIIYKKDHLENTRKNREVKFHEAFGCHEEIVTYINGGIYGWAKTLRYKCKAGEYISQKFTAKARGIGWNISFPEWWSIWEESGKYGLRGRGKGYCMARYGDSGPYEPNNVYICTIGQNFSDSYLMREKKTHCKWGHEKTPNNIYKDGGCVICSRGYSMKRYYENKMNDRAASA